MDPTNINGYSLEEIDDVSKDLLQTLSEVGVNPTLALLALCRSITIIGSPEELDLACRIIDDFSGISADGTAIAAEVWDDTEDDWAV